MLSTASTAEPPQGEMTASTMEDFDLDVSHEMAPPEMLLIDWVELVLLAALLLFGLPLNAIALSKQLKSSSSLLNPRKISRITRQEVTRTNFLWLKLHLTIVDLLVIVCYCPSHIAWLIGYTWSAGELLCKAMQYSWDFCFHLMSFGVVSIALDRLRTVYGLMRMEKTGRIGRPSRQIRFVKRLIWLSYLGAALVSLPQWFVWTTIDLRTWSQCTTIWHKKRAIEEMEGQEITESFSGERLYTLLHLLTVFWLPFLAILVAYAYIVLFLFFYSLRPPCSTSLPVPSANAHKWEPPSPSAVVLLAEEGNNNNNDSDNKPQQPTRKLASVPKGHCETEQMSLWPSAAACTNSTYLPTNTTCCPILMNVGIGSPRQNNDKKTAQHQPAVPAWRLEMRSRIFHTTVHVIAAYLICWLPYNALALATFFSKELQITISVHLELLKICVLLNALLNPFIYGFKRGQP